jgi:sugar lactone lactonase YvrE
MRKQPSGLALILAISVCILSNGMWAEADTLYVSQFNNNQIVTYDTTASPPTPTPFASSGLNVPYGLAFDAAGNLYAANNGNGTIEKFTRGGGHGVFASGVTPYGLAIDSAGNVYVRDGLNSIDKFTRDGMRSVFASTGLSGPLGLAFDSAGNLYVANNLSDTIVKITPGGMESIFASTGVHHPYGLAFDSAGNLYVANNPGTGSGVGDNTIEKFTPGGVGSVFFNYGPGHVGPSGLAFDAQGNLFVTRPEVSLIDKITPDGMRSEFATNPNGLALGIAIQSVPEPSSLVLMGLGALGLVGWHKLRRRD